MDVSDVNRALALLDQSCEENLADIKAVQAKIGEMYPLVRELSSGDVFKIMQQGGAIGKLLASIADIGENITYLGFWWEREGAGVILRYLVQSLHEIPDVASSPCPIPMQTRRRPMDDDEWDEWLEMFEADEFYATCEQCGHEQQVEPDADYPCPECHGGRLISPLMAMGMI